MRIVVIGARRSRQGIGEFVARALHESGAEVCAVVGTREATAQAARAALRERHGIVCRAYANVTEALEAEQPQAVAVCSPIDHHREHLEAVAAAGAHCLCEKPLWWSPAAPAAGRRAETERLVDLFASRGLHLALVTQWPFVLGTFYELFSELEGAPVERFEMALGPVSSGPAMVLDAAPHPLSLLQRLVGYGDVRAADAKWSAADGSSLELEFDYEHARGCTRAKCTFTRCLEPPRPAAIAINGREARRRIALPEYGMFLRGGGREVPMPDPLPLLAKDFVERARKRSATDRRALVESVTGLERLVRASEEASKATQGREV
jgi:predicted dehydrogenase